MCGILVYRDKGDNSRIQKRGQDFTNEFKSNGYTFIHNLLSVTGEFTPQPFVKEGIVCVYNGEIYNHKFVKSDGEVLIPLYEEHGENFVKYLEGEWAIALYDFKKGIAVFATDLFASKPLFVNGTECGSYRSGVGGEKLNPNTIRTVDLKSGEFTDKEIYEWDFNQFKTDFKDWDRAFTQAVKRRAKDGCFIGLSSGYDSGAIACEMLKQGFKFKAYIFQGNENQDILKAREQLVPEFEYFTPKKYDLPIDNERYTIHYKGEQTEMKILDDGGTYGVATMCDLAQKEGRKVMMSGQGADEIFSDYALFKEQSEFKGTFPVNLKKWRNFDRGCQESYLMKEEYAAGAFNIETRYPYLDKDVVQEFLWLAPELKNGNYKAPLFNYLTNNKFPFEANRKIGFSVKV